jgi:hypothetical protein
MKDVLCLMTGAGKTWGTQLKSLEIAPYAK